MSFAKRKKISKWKKGLITKYSYVLVDEVSNEVVMHGTKEYCKSHMIRWADSFTTFSIYKRVHV